MTRVMSLPIKTVMEYKAHDASLRSAPEVEYIVLSLRSVSFTGIDRVTETLTSLYDNKHTHVTYKQTHTRTHKPTQITHPIHDLSVIYNRVGSSIEGYRDNTAQLWL